MSDEQKKFLLAVDFGSTSLVACVFDLKTNLIAKASTKVKFYRKENLYTSCSPQTNWFLVSWNRRWKWISSLLLNSQQNVVWNDIHKLKFHPELLKDCSFSLWIHQKVTEFFLIFSNDRKNEVSEKTGNNLFKLVTKHIITQTNLK